MAWDPSFGARPLKRVIQQKVENALAGRILSGRVRDGQHVTIDAAGKSLTFEADAPAEGQADTEVLEGEIVDG